MSTFAHFVIALAFSTCIYKFTRNSHRKFNISHAFLFMIGSLLPDLLAFLDIVPNFFGEVTNYNPLRYYYHNISAWIAVSLLYTIFFRILIKFLNEETGNKTKITFKQIYLILLASGFMHFGIDMLSEPVGLIGDIFVSITSFYTPYGILGEQDLAYIIFIFITFNIPMGLCLFSLQKFEKQNPFLNSCEILIKGEAWDSLVDYVNIAIKDLEYSLT